MLENKQNIDDIFSDALCEYQEEAPYYSWTNIQEDLICLKRKKRLTIIKNVGILVASVLTFILGYWAANYNLYEKSEALYLKTIQKSRIVTFRNSDNRVNDAKGNSTYKKENYTTKKKIAVDNNNNSTSKKKLAAKYYQHKTINISSSKTKKETKHSNIKRHNQLLTNALLCKVESRQSGGSQLLDHNSVESNWSFGAKFSPIYSINVLNESSDNSSDNYVYANGNDMSKVTSEILSAYTGGINVNYRLSKRFSIESGLFYSTRKQLSTMSGIASAHTVAKANTKDIVNDKLPSTAAYRRSTHTSISYTQDLDYLELPFSVRYKLIDRKIGLDLSGGMSTNLLIKNSISSENTNYTLPQNANSMLYNAKFSLGVNYRFRKQMKFNIEPTLRYSINPSSNSFLKDYPYSFAIFAGFIYNLQ